MKGSKHLVGWEAVGQCPEVLEARSLQGLCVSSAPQPVCFLLSSGFVDVPLVAFPAVCTASHTSGVALPLALPLQGQR